MTLPTYIRSQPHQPWPPAEHVAYLRAEANYTHVHPVSGKAMLFAVTLKQVMLQKYPDAGFIQIHKSHAVNPAYLREVSTRKKDPWVQVYTQTGLVKLAVSRRRINVLQLQTRL